MTNECLAPGALLAVSYLDSATFGREGKSKSFFTSCLTRGRRLGQFAILPSLWPRVKRRRSKDFDMLTSYELALSNYTSQ